MIQSNKIVEWATNSNYEPPKHHGYSSRIQNNQAFGHSELAVWFKSKGILNGNFELVNIRINKDGELRMSKPCVCCHPILTKLGCTKFYFSSEIGFLTC